ncbi:hypothetical protein KM176_16535 [Pseudooceanicola sp. CBS1P-1]|uniref:Uncharacterized protein n=1 Tax=Pseudooceanicola albus TaxID=2692189 RepID=A0A6L7G4Q7_9RHOB|nr:MULTISPECIES: hypothetical protein [Pseudooceanicola]MBT9385483.1 hypothetical protein [Pseudooceanicola endophyticus]MXN19105.1 hypothetical protein [Pseudooceanicola albus]
MRKALELKVETAKPWADCAREAGMSEAGIHKARKQPHVQALFDDIKAQYVQRIETMKKVHEARALEVARELLDQTDNKQVRARMVEFLRREPAGPAVAVQINNGGAGGYEFVRPGSRVVEISVSSDDGSGDHEGE